MDQDNSITTIVCETISTLYAKQNLPRVGYILCAGFVRLVITS